MNRSPDRAAADEALTKAIGDASGVEDAVIGDYVVLVSFTRYTEDGTQENIFTCIDRDGLMPLYRTLGLVAYAHSALAAGIQTAAGSGEEEIDDDGPI